MPTPAEKYLEVGDLDSPEPAVDADALAAAIKADPSFIGEAITAADLTNLVSAYNRVDLQWCWDAIHDAVEDHFKNEVKRRPENTESGAVKGLARLHGIEL